MRRLFQEDWNGKFPVAVFETNPMYSFCLDTTSVFEECNQKELFPTLNDRSKRWLYSAGNYEREVDIRADIPRF